MSHLFGGAVLFQTLCERESDQHVCGCLERAFTISEKGRLFTSDLFGGVVLFQTLHEREIICASSCTFSYFKMGHGS